MKNKFSRIFKELVHHLPYSAVGVAASLGILLGFEKMGWRGKPELFFHIAHPAHILISAIVTTAMFWKYEQKFLKACFIGLFCTHPVCTVSDIGIPYLGAFLLGTPVQFHLCIIEEPWLVFPASFLGILLGILFLKWVERLTEFGHLSHVLISALASIFYLISFDVSLWSGSIGMVFFITLVAVWLPCCLSDIVFPLAWVKGGHPPCCGHHPHEI